VQARNALPGSHAHRYKQPGFEKCVRNQVQQGIILGPYT
jgi:hypothetical protein